MDKKFLSKSEKMNLNKSYSNMYRSHVDINIMNFGRQVLNPGEKISEKVLLHNTLYYIETGKVEYTSANKKYIVQSNRLFLASATYSSGFIAIGDEPVVFYWISFWGNEAKRYLDSSGLTVNKPIFDKNDDKIGEIMFKLTDECMGNNMESDIRALGYLYLLLSRLFVTIKENLADQQKNKVEYIQQAIQYIRSNYMLPITVQDISEYVALNRTYFSGLFKEIIGISPKEYLMKYRIDQASNLLTNPLLSIGQIAELSGFSDIINFSRRFKAFNSLSPSEYRKVMFDKSAHRLRAKEKDTKKPTKS